MACPAWATRPRSRIGSDIRIHRLIHRLRIAAGLGGFLDAQRELLLRLLLGTKFGDRARCFGARGEAGRNRRGAGTIEIGKQRAARVGGYGRNRIAGSAKAEPVKSERCCFFTAGEHGFLRPIPGIASKPLDVFIVAKVTLGRGKTPAEALPFVHSARGRIASAVRGTTALRRSMRSRKYLMWQNYRCESFAFHGRTDRHRRGAARRPRHPEKAHRPDQPVLQKPGLDPRQGAGVAGLYRDAADRAATTACTRCARRPAARISASAGTRSTPPS